MGDGRRQPPHCRQPVLHAYLALQAADLGQVVETVNLSQHAPVGHAQRGDDHAEGFSETIGGNLTDFPMRPLCTHVRKWIDEQVTDWLSHQLALAVLQQLFSRLVYKGDVAVQTGRDDPSADRLNDVFVQGP